MIAFIDTIYMYIMLRSFGSGNLVNSRYTRLVNTSSQVVCVHLTFIASSSMLLPGAEVAWPR